MVLRRQYRQLREELAKLSVPEGLEDLNTYFNPYSSQNIPLPPAPIDDDSHMISTIAGVKSNLKKKSAMSESVKNAICDSICHAVSMVTSDKLICLNNNNNIKKKCHKKDATNNNSLHHLVTKMQEDVNLCVGTSHASETYLVDGGSGDVHEDGHSFEEPMENCKYWW